MFDIGGEFLGVKELKELRGVKTNALVDL